MKDMLLSTAERVFGRKVEEDENLFTIEANINIANMLYFFLEIEKKLNIRIPISAVEEGAFYDINSIHEMLTELTS